ncbi:uncharacterized protein LOC118436410 isoform X2 [Folsomia candida]|uniref:uncharacterized protein LOC118436410 isoform X2 n=1 Tax=Folsomia candida TaxID=158441 RepID=UPI0016051D56|nr:uncharacterized protein LOC118436410 isoform X2 [Folsomia candida]
MLTSCISTVLLVLVVFFTRPTTHTPQQAASKNGRPSNLILAPSLLELEVVVVLPSPSKRSLSLSRTLSRTLNAQTAADLVSQLDFPEKNVTWKVSNFYLTGSPPSVKEALVGGQDDEDDEDDDDDDVVEEQSGYFGDEADSVRVLPPKGGGGGGKVGESSLHFSPPSLPVLCDFLSGGRALAIVSLVPERVGHQRLLSLVTSAIHVPLVAQSALTTLKDEEDFFINLSSSVRDMARALVLLLIHCHWHTFTLLLDDSPRIRASQVIWETELRARIKLPNRPGGSRNGTSSSDYYTPDMDYPEEEGGQFDDAAEWSLRPNTIILQTRFPNSAFRALSEVTKATQGVILLVLTHRSTMAVFQAAKQLRMLNGDYIFIMVDPRAQFESIPDWIPHGVLALQSPRLPWMNKRKMKMTGSLLASALLTLKDEPFSGRKKQFVSSGHSPKRVGGGAMAGGVFSGFTNRDFQTEGELDFAGEQEPDEDVTNNNNNNVNNKGDEESGGPTFLEVLEKLPNLSCYEKDYSQRKLLSGRITTEIRRQMLHPDQDSSTFSFLSPPVPLTYQVLNLVRTTAAMNATIPTWNKVGSVSSNTGVVRLDTIRWPGGGIFGPGGDERPSKSYRVVTIVAPPFVMESQAEDNRTCVRGLPCLKVKTQRKDDLAVLFAEFESTRGLSPPAYELACCDGLAMDLLASVARELKFEIDLFLVPDGYFGSKNLDGSWNGLMNLTVSGAAHLCFAPISILSVRATAVDFSTPFFFSGVGLLGISKERDVPLLAFLAPFSPTLWAAIFITLNLTALVVAIYEWFSPFGLNPWGRQRTKNFSISSALWVVWGRLFSHLVAFKAPKSWPNKFLINVWGGFSVIFVASYTANIAALFAGMFFERHVDVNDRSLLSQRVTAIKHSATDFYIKKENPHLWEHIQRFPVHSFQEGVQRLKNGSLDLLIGDGPLLDYFRGTDSSCNLIDVSDHDKIGDDSYAVAMTKGFPLKDSVSGLIAKYLGNGYLDYLQGKWYGQMPCFSKSQQAGARALGVDAVAGCVIMLGVAMGLGILILFVEHLIFKHALPFWRAQPKGTLWRSPNLMFFSQKLYRFINCVELVSPHHAAKELAKTLRQGQITSLFQKSVKREHEQRRRRKSKAQFYEMIQEIKRVQMAEKAVPPTFGNKRPPAITSSVGSRDDESCSSAVYSIQGRLEREGGGSSSSYLPPRLLSAAPGGEEILIADYPPSGERIGPQGAASSLDDPPSTSASDTGATQRRRIIQWRHPRPGIVPSPMNPTRGRVGGNLSQQQPPGILRRGGGGSGGSCGGGQMLEVSTTTAETRFSSKASGTARSPPPPQKRRTDNNDTEDDEDDDDGGLSDDDDDDVGEGDEYEWYSPLDKADLKSLSKNQIIEMWRASELDLRRQLSQALKAKDELSVALSRTDTPAMMVEFDQVKL